MFHISEGLLLGLLIIPILAFLIIIHELGHFFAARSVGVTVEEFGIGLPPRAKGWRWKGVLWSLNWIPFGGFVRVKGEDGSDLEPGSMNSKKPWQRAWFLIAGPLMNFIAAIVLSIILIGFQGLPSETNHIYIGQVSSNSPAQIAGWQPGDSITAVEGQPITSTSQLQSLIKSYAGKPVAITIKRGDETIETTVTPRKNPPANQGATGITMGEAIVSGIHFTDVDQGSVAEKAGLKHGDTLVSVDGVSIEAAQQGTSLLQNSQGKTVPIVVKRGGKDVSLSLPVPTLSLLLTAVAKDSPAADAGLFGGDHVVSVNGTPIPDGASFQSALIANSGKTVTVGIVRNVVLDNGGTQTKNLEVKLEVPKIGGSDNPVGVV
ncbi:MAG TPA: RIP metalloprotease RseP, partial [Thermomicrobiales bacterium]|nr:RIP metalloprotease RseP [Thermomicrobiales bacterium]